MNAARSHPPDPTSTHEAAERAQRVAEMLDRWTAEPLPEEPDWIVEQVAPLVLRGPDSSDKG